MRVRVGERAETVIVLLTSGIPKSKLDVLSVDLDIGDVVLEDSGNVHLEVQRQLRQPFTLVLYHVVTKRLLSDSGGVERRLTSGKVPLEKTLPGTLYQFTAQEIFICRLYLRAVGDWILGNGYSHEKTSLTAGTVTHDDKLAADLSHLDTRKKSLMSADAANSGYESGRWQ